MGQARDPGGILARYRVFVFYDDWCTLCRRAVAGLRRLDLLGLLVPVSFRTPGVAARFRLDPGRAALRLHAQAAAAAGAAEGIEAVILLASRLPPAWPVVPILWLASRVGLGQRVYDWIASRRTIIPAAGAGHAP